MSESIAKKLAPLIRDLYAARNAIREACSEFAFTLDGKIVGDLGEAIALRDFGLERLPSGSSLHDFKAPDGRLVQVKTTQATASGCGVGLGLKKQSFKHLVVFQISEDGSYTILYDGPGNYIDDARAHKKSASLSVLQLRRLNQRVKAHERVLENT